MPRVNTDHIFKSTYAILTTSKDGLDKLIVELGLDSMADLLNMLGQSPAAAGGALKTLSESYMAGKLTSRDEARKEREAARLREKLAKLEGPAQ